MVCVCVCLSARVRACVRVCVLRGVSDSLRKHGDTLIHADGEIRVKHGRHCHRSLTAEE